MSTQETNWREVRPTKSWRHRIDNALVEVVRREEQPFEGHGPYRWHVYLYIYPNHPRFEQVKDGDWSDLHFNGHTIRWVNWNDDATEITSIKIGSDYMHSWDTISNTPDACEPFADANRLIKSLCVEMEEVQ